MTLLPQIRERQHVPFHEHAQAVPVARMIDCYVDRLRDGLVDYDDRLAIIFDETTAVERWDAETDPEQRGPIDQSRDTEVWARTVVIWNSFYRVLIVDHFVLVTELGDSRRGTTASGRWHSGKYDVAARVLARLGWEHPHGPGEWPVRRRQAVCNLREQAVREAVAASDEWIEQVAQAARDVHAEVDRDRAVQVLAGVEYQGNDDGIPI